ILPGPHGPWRVVDAGGELAGRGGTGGATRGGGRGASIREADPDGRAVAHDARGCSRSAEATPGGGHTGSAVRRIPRSDSLFAARRSQEQPSGARDQRRDGARGRGGEVSPGGFRIGARSWNRGPSQGARGRGCAADPVAR